MNPILVPLRNGRDLTIAAHRTFIAQDVGDIEILYIDNASTDGTREWLQSLSVHCIHNLVPMGVSRSWNVGLNWWFSQGAEHVLVCNNDVLLRPDTYRWLLKAGGLFVTAVGNNDPDCVKPPWNPPDLDKIRYNPDYSCYLIHKEAYERMGGFDEKFKGAYAEDADSHLRLHRAGVDAFCIQLPFYHVGAATLKNATDEERQLILEQADANRVLFKEKHGVAVGTPEYYALFGDKGQNPDNKFGATPPDSNSAR